MLTERDLSNWVAAIVIRAKETMEEISGILRVLGKLEDIIRE